MKEFKIISHATNNQQLWLCGGGGGVPLLCFRIYTTDIKTIIGPTWLFFFFFSFLFPPPDILSLQIVTHGWLSLNQIHLQQHLNVFIASRVVNVIIISYRGFRNC